MRLSHYYRRYLFEPFSPELELSFYPTLLSRTCKEDPNSEKKILQKSKISISGIVSCTSF